MQRADNGSYCVACRGGYEVLAGAFNATGIFDGANCVYGTLAMGLRALMALYCVEKVWTREVDAQKDGLVVCVVVYGASAVGVKPVAATIGARDVGGQADGRSWPVLRYANGLWRNEKHDGEKKREGVPCRGRRGVVVVECRGRETEVLWDERG